MKKILKILLMPAFVILPTMTVIACGGSGVQVSPADILNSAVGEMQDHTFNMNSELNLNSLPAASSRYSDLSSTTRGLIGSYYKKLVEPGLNWSYPAVNVQLSGATNAVFLVKYGTLVEARIVVSAHLTYQSEATDKNIVVKITNDNTNKEQKINAIGDYLKTYLNTNPTFSFSTLLPDNLASNAPGINTQLAKITAGLNPALFNDSTLDGTGVPVIDVAGIDLSIQLASPNTNTVVYTLNNSAIDSANQVVNAIIQNLILTIGYANGTQYNLNLSDLTANNLQVNQKISSASNQISNILNQGSGIKTPLTTLPTASQTFKNYDDSNANALTTAVQNSFFNLISNYYTPAKMGGSWTATLITIDNAATTPYIIDDATNGHFFVDLSFTYSSGGVNIIGTVSNVQLDITQQ